MSRIILPSALVILAFGTSAQAELFVRLGTLARLNANLAVSSDEHLAVDHAFTTTVSNRLGGNYGYSTQKGSSCQKSSCQKSSCQKSSCQKSSCQKSSCQKSSCGKVRKGHACQKSHCGLFSRWHACKSPCGKGGKTKTMGHGSPYVPVPAPMEEPQIVPPAPETPILPPQPGQSAHRIRLFPEGLQLFPSGFDR